MTLFNIPHLDAIYESDALSDELQDECLDIYSLRVAGDANVIHGVKNRSKSSFFINLVYP